MVFIFTPELLLGNYSMAVVLKLPVKGKPIYNVVVKETQSNDVSYLQILSQNLWSNLI